MVLQYVPGYGVIDVPAASNSTYGTADTSTGAYDGTEQVSYTINKEFNVSKSLLTVNTDNDATTNSVILKNSNISTSGGYYAFGTTMFFKATINDVKQSGGMGFFLDSAKGGATGYYVSIATTSTAAAQKGNSFNFYKVIGGKKYPLTDSQSVSDAAKLRGIYNGSSYKVDIFVKVESTKTTLVAYVNGFKITATDAVKTVGGASIPMLGKTSTIGLFASLGTAAFDYVYAMPITAEQFSSSQLYNIYKQGFAKTTVDIAYGDLFISGLTEAESATTTKYVEEFGPVAREIRNIKGRYDSTPAIPKYVTTGINQSVAVLGQRLGVFSADIYVLNTSGTYVPLDDGNSTSFAIIGPTITKSSPLEYMDDQVDKYSPQEPITFTSQWIQKESDARNLSNWIKEQWKNKQMVADITIFANPLIAVSDIIVIDYAYNDLAITQKFVVTNVTQSWRDGLTTSISARSIYS
jgi:hypothetical protein